MSSLRIRWGWLTVAGYGAGMACFVAALLVDDTWQVLALIAYVLTFGAAVVWFRRSRRGEKEQQRLALGSAGVQLMLAIRWVTDDDAPDSAAVEAMDMWDRRTRRFAIILWSGYLVVAILGLILSHVSE